MLEVRKDESLEGLNQQLNAISCNNNSILSKCRPLNELQQEGKDLMMDMLEELAEKAPILFNVLVAAAGKISSSVLAPISSVYGLLMFQRNHMMSAWQRCISAKFYKAMYDKGSVRSEGSLAYFKAKLQRTDVSGKVKGHFKSHMAFLSFTGESVIAEQGRQFISDLDIEIEDGDDKFEV
ncbi:unnamed protein product [Mytilus edulis]|uniref:Uncharacterized protein n=1 Tax=Mytilus edulis TaxID=6550 RepID=A0A8S3S4I3_MYTED|nr:unnamed protein product [Mytilus edulis]